jgi:hypothetical protein
LRDDLEREVVLELFTWLGNHFEAKAKAFLLRFFITKDEELLKGFLSDFDNRVCVLRGQWTAHATKVSDTS